ncbi:putative polycomb protein, VEFS-Box [Helianthus annuus]|nr:putative polycomb protein, VEFS-Box [Helianthus annuus]
MASNSTDYNSIASNSTDYNSIASNSTFINTKRTPSLMEKNQMAKNEWNQYQGRNKGLPIKEVAENYKLYKEKKEIETNTEKEPKKKTGNKTRIRCRPDLFREVLKNVLKDNHKKDVISKTPFAKLIELSNSISLDREIVKSIVKNFNLEDMTLTIYEEGNAKAKSITKKHFYKIMGIQDGKVVPKDKTKQVNADLLDKYCKKENNGKYKYIYMKKVEEMFEKTQDDNVIRQTFALIALNYIVCPAASGVLGKRYLSYVENANELHEQAWASLAVESLKNGIQTYMNGDGIEKNLGGCVLLLQLYCMTKRMKAMNISKIKDVEIKEFRDNLMIDKKTLAKKICRDQKHISNVIKGEPETVELELLLELDKLNMKFMECFRTKKIESLRSTVKILMMEKREQQMKKPQNEPLKTYGRRKQTEAGQLFSAATGRAAVEEDDAAGTTIPKPKKQKVSQRTDVSIAADTVFSGPEEASPSVPGSSVTPTTLRKSARSRKLRKGRKNQSLLERRQFFHSQTGQPMSPEQVFAEEDSEDEVDDEVLDLEDRMVCSFW